MGLGRMMWRVDGGKCLQSGTNSRISADVWKNHQGSNIRKRVTTERL